MGIAELGRLDVVVANAGICTFGRTWELTEEQWEEMIAIDLSGVWRTVKATVPDMLRQQTGGSIILISSQSGLAGFHGQAHYCAAKHGIIGMMKTLAQEVGPDNIRVNALCPTTVNTVMFNNPMMKDIFCPDLDNPSEEEFLRRASALNCFGIPYIEPDDVSEAVLYLASDASRFMTGTSFLLDAGCLAKPA
jgi:NAD(P)-dependent dehydrogenase (short-subunit alcohol dehydrogenase family)